MAGITFGTAITWQYFDDKARTAKFEALLAKVHSLDANKENS